MERNVPTPTLVLAAALLLAGGAAARAAETNVTLADHAIAVSGPGATVDGNRLLITAAGRYRIGGTLSDGQIVVDAPDDADVELVLDGVDVTNATGAAIFVVRADNALITLADGSDNRLTDAHEYVLDDPESNEPNAAVFSKDDLTIGGGGSLTVHANHANGIQGKDDLRITGGTITVHAVGNGVKGKDSVVVTGGVLEVHAGNDGIQASNAEDPARGFVHLTGGTVVIVSGDDGIQAETRVLVRDATLTITAGGGAAAEVRQAAIARGTPTMRLPETATAVDADEGRAKGIKANVEVTLESGTVTVDAADDAIHANDAVTILGGRLRLASGDDAIHADSTIDIRGGDIEIIRCYEGIESASITIDHGTIHITASDDGINAASGGGGFAPMRRTAPPAFGAAGDDRLHVNGGTIVIDAAGDGIDVNGSITMTGGTVIIHGPTANMEGAIDYDRTFDLNGGVLVAAGSAGMAQAPSASSTQPSLMMNFASTLPAGTLIHIESEGGETVFTLAPPKAFQSLLVSSPALRIGTRYTVYGGGASTGVETDGVYAGGAYSGGTEAASFALTQPVTVLGSARGGAPVRRPSGRRRRSRPAPTGSVGSTAPRPLPRTSPRPGTPAG